ncbi:hypothetical protein MKO06_03775 [Gramella sp. GC03-9]|uniref:NrS-1 polymerase-like helicase domain-containing protein n=1 Tax=Christiangramia oceanisediminis TaxID=2920386 RepID=A0A9X2I967_9FLAO|nr:DUF5906 domain-containing protein [Gramella oceanisediminis]MCP9199013.1 hypothetical protein [Gramella oceanisediminis]
MNRDLRDKVQAKVFDIKYGEAELFWYEVEKIKNGRPTTEYIVEPTKLKQFIVNSGFRLHEDKLVYLKNNIVEITTPEKIYKFCYNYISQFQETNIESAFIKQGTSYLIKNKGIVTLLPELGIPLVRDSINISYKFYKNGIVKIELNKPLELIEYKDAPGFVWKDSIQKRNIHLHIASKKLGDKAMFEKFIENLSNDSNHFNSICSALGYAIHTFKDARKPICLIFNDEVQTDTSKPQGGTGKGLIVKGISEIVGKAAYNGKNSDFTNNKFAFQHVCDSTGIILIDDAPRNFAFESLFSVLSDDLPVEVKHQPVRIVPFKNSPKFVITTNYTIKGDSPSYKRRRFDIFLRNHYSDTFQPNDEFDCEFFHGWDEEEWNLFDHFMFECLKTYLDQGLIPYNSESLRLKMLCNETSVDFYELMEEHFNHLEVKMLYQTVRNKLIKEYGSDYKYIDNNKNLIIDWISRYAEFKGYQIAKKRANKGNTFIFSK